MGIVERLEPNTLAWKVDLGSHLKRYRFAAQFIRGKRVLDAGCGVGYGSRLLAQEGALAVVAVDISADALAIARSQFAHPSVSYLQDDCEVLANVAGCFDVIISFENIEHLRNPSLFATRSAELLNADGLLICSTPNNPKGAQTENPFHEHEFSQQQFVALFRPYFSSIEIVGQEFSAAYRGMQHFLTNPLVRLGELLQRLRGYPPFTMPPATEADFVISTGTAEPWTLIALCRGPKKTAPRADMAEALVEAH